MKSFSRIFFNIFFILFIGHKSQAQQFNKTIIPINSNFYSGAWGRGMILQNLDSIYLSGICGSGDSATNFYNRIHFMHLLDNGDTVANKLISIDSMDLYPMQGCLLKLNDTVKILEVTGAKCYNIGPSVICANKVVLYWLKNNGDILLQKEYHGNGWLSGLCMYDYGNGVILTGTTLTSAPADTNYQVCIINTDYFGNVKWQKYLGIGNRADYGFSTCKAANGGFYISAWTDVIFGGVAGAITDGYTSIYRIDSNGNTVWKKKMYKNTYSYTDRIREDGIGNYYLSSFIDSLAEPDDNTTSNCVIAKLDSVGNIKWEYIFNDVPNACKGAWDYQVLANSDLLLYGTIYGGIYNEDYGWLCRMDSSGHVLWEHLYKSYSGSTFGYLCDGVQMADGGFMLTGSAIDSATHKQAIWLIRTDSIGCLIPGCVSPSAIQYEFEDIQHVSLYPNPSSGDFVLEYSKSMASNATLSIFDMTGRKVYADQVQKGAYKSLVSLPSNSGVYLLQLIDNGKGKVIYTQKMRID
jgi:hypothetical protein